MNLPTIPPLDQAAMKAAEARQRQLTKPQGSLGRLEELSVQLAGIYAHPLPSIREKAVIVMAGDHGVVAEGQFLLTIISCALWIAFLRHLPQYKATLLAMRPQSQRTRRCAAQNQHLLWLAREDD